MKLSKAKKKVVEVLGTPEGEPALIRKDCMFHGSYIYPFAKGHHRQRISSLLSVRGLSIDRNKP